MTKISAHLIFAIAGIIFYSCNGSPEFHHDDVKLDYNIIRNLAIRQYNDLDTLNSNKTIWLLAKYINEDIKDWAGRDTALAVLYRYSKIYPSHEGFKYLSVYPPSRELTELAYELLHECHDPNRTGDSCSRFYTRRRMGAY